MRYGIREICDVVLKAKSTITIGNKKFYKGEPVIYFDSLKTSTLEGAATTVYAQGGRGNSRLVAWEGERTLTFTMEDALISTAGFMILSGAGLVDATEQPIYVHTTETVEVDTTENEICAWVSKLPATDKAAARIYAMLMKNGEITTEPYIATLVTTTDGETETPTTKIEGDKTYYKIKIANITNLKEEDGTITPSYVVDATATTPALDSKQVVFSNEDVIMVDYYHKMTSGAEQIEITADKFGGNYYLEASTLFRDTNGVDMPAEFIIPNCKIQSNFTFTMASSGDPSTFTFTMDAFPDYTKFDNTKKVLAAIQVISDSSEEEDLYRKATYHGYTTD